MSIRRSLAVRFSERWQHDPEQGCWHWLGVIDAGGYGRIKAGGQGGVILSAHRVSYELYKGPIPEGLHIDHLCTMRSCVNPKHLEAVTPLENHRRMTRTINVCLHGHVYDYNNTYYTNRGSRECRECHKQHSRRDRGIQTK